MKTGKQNVMRLRYAEELLRIKNYEKCERILMEVVDSRTDPTDIETLREHVSYWMLLSKLHLETGNSDEAAKDLLKAKQLQSKMLARSPNEVGNPSGEKKLASSICCKLAELYRTKREYLRAIDFYKEAIEIDNKDIRSMLALAHLYYTMGKIQQCNQQCQAILNIDRNNNEATLVTHFLKVFTLTSIYF
uniref:Tetratricopeptide repeat protein 21A/21B fourth ARM domain-containing protein n=1 Tax=Panagrolaimus davidi TaxID=227884 RepID=A0A914NX93_9BILA